MSLKDLKVEVRGESKNLNVSFTVITMKKQQFMGEIGNNYFKTSLDNGVMQK